MVWVATDLKGHLVPTPKSLGSLFAGRPCKSGLVVLWLQAVTFSEGIPVTANAAPWQKSLG